MREASWDSHQDILLGRGQFLRFRYLDFLIQMKSLIVSIQHFTQQAILEYSLGQFLSETGDAFPLPSVLLELAECWMWF